MSFTLQSTETGATKTFSTKHVLGLLPAGDTVNDNIEMGEDVFQMSSCSEGGGVNGTLVTDVDKAHWNNAPVVAGIVTDANGVTGLNLNTHTAWDSNNTKAIDYGGYLTYYANTRRAVFWHDSRHSLGSPANFVGLFWAYTSSVGGQYPQSFAGYDRALLDGSNYLGHGAAALDWKYRFLLDYQECLAINWDSRQMLSGFPPFVHGAVGDVTVDFSKGVRPRQVTLAQRLAIPLVPADYGLDMYQLDGTEGLYRYKSTGWAFIG